MHENTLGRVTFLVNLLFRRLGKVDGPILRRREREAYVHIYGGTFIRVVNWVTYLGGHIFGRGDLYTREVH